MSEPIELYEYGSVTVQLEAEQARRLTSVGQGALRVEYADERGHYCITAQNMVGTLVVDDLRVLIRPKIKPENLFLLLEVGLPENAWRQEAFDYARSADLLPSVVAFYARTLETTLARGLLRSYRPEEERLVALRGRINVTAQFRQAGIRVPVACRYDEYTPDIAENRYLKAATRLALRVPGVEPSDRQRLRRQVVALEDVADGWVAPDDFDRISFTRLNEHYRPALRLARLLLANLTLQDRAGDRSASSFLIDMNQLFERFVTERLRRKLNGHLQVQDQARNHLDVGCKVPIRPDLVFRRGGSEVYVADIKYKLIEDAKAKQSDYYQLLAYTTALDLPEGVLIYCLADGGKPEQMVTVKHSGKVLHTCAIDLSGTPDKVDSAISDLAGWLRERVRGSNQVLDERLKLAKVADLEHTVAVDAVLGDDGVAGVPVGAGLGV